MVPLPSLNAMRAFEAVARLGTVASASEELFVTPTAISRHIKNLERTLGVQLFDRSEGHLVLTRRGALYARALREAFAAIYGATDQLKRELVQTPLHVRAYTTFLVRWLIPRVADFQRKHPSVSLRLSTDFDAVNFERDDVDLGVRYGAGRWLDVSSTLLFSDEIVLIGDRQAGERFASADPVEALSDSTLLAHSLRPSDWPDWFTAAGLPHVSGRATVVLDDLSLIYQSALDGAGVGLVQLRYVRADLRERRIFQLSPTILRRKQGFYLVCKPQSVGRESIVAFTEWAVAQMAADDAAADPPPP